MTNIDLNELQNNSQRLAQYILDTTSLIQIWLIYNVTMLIHHTLKGYLSKNTEIPPFLSLQFLVLANNQYRLTMNSSI